jgi:hypothetical protein
VSDARVREATFATKDPFIAEYIRRRIAAGEFRDMIYEEVRPGGDGRQRRAGPVHPSGQRDP